jgi:hypothetical protein
MKNGASFDAGCLGIFLLAWGVVLITAGILSLNAFMLLGGLVLVASTAIAIKQ